MRGMISKSVLMQRSRDSTPCARSGGVVSGLMSVPSRTAAASYFAPNRYHPRLRAEHVSYRALDRLTAQTSVAHTGG